MHSFKSEPVDAIDILVLTAIGQAYPKAMEASAMPKLANKHTLGLKTKIPTLKQ
jgi:hypothetical protein